MIIDPAEWPNFAAIPIADQVPHGPVHRPVPNFPMPPPLGGNPGVNAIEIHREAAQTPRRHTQPANFASHLLQQTLITSIGPINEERLVDAVTNTLDLSCFEIVTRMAASYNTMTPAIATDLHAALDEPLLGIDVESYQNHCTKFNGIITRLTRAAQPPATAIQFRQFGASCSGHAAAADAYTRFCQNNPTLAVQRLDTLQDYILTQLRCVSVAAVARYQYVILKSPTRGRKSKPY
jgi:hypothetical protein